MNISRLSSDLSISSQISIQDIATVKAANFRAIICNRPDGESLGQPEFRDIEAAAKAAGLEIRFQPITPGKISAGDVETFAAALRDLPKPVLAFCASGNRAGTLWTQAQAQGLVSA